MDQERRKNGELKRNVFGVGRVSTREPHLLAMVGRFQFTLWIRLSDCKFASECD